MNNIVITFAKSLAAWSTPVFDLVFKQEVRNLEPAQLPLQAAISHSSHVSETRIEPVLLATAETSDAIRVKAGIFYSGVIAGSCCADDPSPLCEQTEYCELQFDINKHSAVVTIVLLSI